MTDHSETARARELLASSEALLNRVRNRPVVEIPDWPDRESRTVEVPVRKINANARVERTMDAQNSAAWNEWAQRKITAAMRGAGRATGDALRERDERIAKLEQRIVDLEKATGTAKVIEWPVGGRAA